jgi:hypothetical protein
MCGFESEIQVQIQYINILILFQSQNLLFSPIPSQDLGRQKKGVICSFSIASSPTS